MKPVDQTRFGYPNGNCFAACVASILELSIDEVWDAGEFDEKMNNNVDFWLGWQRWLATRGFGLVHILDGAWFLPPVGYGVANGISDRGLRHSVVTRDGVMVHDPNPKRSGLVGRPESWVILYRADPVGTNGGNHGQP